MAVEAIHFEKLADPSEDGLLQIPGFLDEEKLEGIWAELDDPKKVDWIDVHDTYENKRGLTIIQNHFAYALKLSRGDQAPLEKIPEIKKAADKISLFVQRLWDVYPKLATWQPDELSLHRYDNANIGLSQHQDNLRFIGVIAIASLEGECDIAIHNGKTKNLYPTVPGDLILLRAPGLTNSEEDLRPEHSVINLRNPTRTSMMLRANNRPNEAIPGFQFANWQPERTS